MKLSINQTLSMETHLAMYNSLSNLIKSQQVESKELRNSQQHLYGDIMKLKKSQRIAACEGRIGRLERSVNIQYEEIVNLRTLSMRDNLIV